MSPRIARKVVRGPVTFWSALSSKGGEIVSKLDAGRIAMMAAAALGTGGAGLSVINHAQVADSQAQVDTLQVRQRASRDSIRAERRVFRARFDSLVVEVDRLKRRVARMDGSRAHNNATFDGPPEPSRPRSPGVWGRVRRLWPFGRQKPLDDPADQG